MIGHMLIGVRIILDGLLQDVQKRYQLRKPLGVLSHCIYALIIGTTSLLLYGAAAGFRLRVNGVTLMYALTFACVVGVNFVMPFLVLRHTDMVTASLFSRVGSLALVMLFSFLVLGEPVSFRGSLGALLMCCAAVLPLLRGQERTRAKGRGYVLALVASVFTGLSRILSKLYASDPGAEGSHGAYCFYVNVFLVLGWGLYMLVMAVKKRDNLGQSLRLFRAPVLRLILLCAVLSALSTLFDLYALELIDLSYYTVITGAAGLIVVALLSRFRFREPLGKLRIASIGLALLSILLTA